MDKDYIQNLRYKLQKRVRRLNSGDFQVFHFMIKQFWGFLCDQPTFASILQELDVRSSKVAGDVERIFSDKDPVVFETEEENALACYLVLKRCAKSDNQNIELQIARTYSNERNSNEVMEAFRDIFVEPLYEYIDENLDDTGFVLALLRKYKHRSEWFRRNSLHSAWEAETKHGEKLLALDLYEYLHDQGIEFSIEPTSVSGEVDLVAAQTSDEPLIADAKIFNPGKSKGVSYIAKGFRQVYSYTTDFNQPVGYLVIFKTCEEDLRLPFANQSQSTPFVQHNNKTIFFLVIDLYPYETSASKRGKLQFKELSEDQLWENLGAE